jgi:adenine-specific DNA methylase
MRVSDTGHAIPEARIELDYSREVFDNIPLPRQALEFPELRYMGSKHRLLPWIHGVLRGLDFETAADPFVGSGSVAYLLKAMGKRVIASDFLNFPAVLASATIANSKHRIDESALQQLLSVRRNGPNFIQKTFDGVFYEKSDLQFLDRVSANIDGLAHPHQRALAKAALIRSCLKKQPRTPFGSRKTALDAFDRLFRLYRQSKIVLSYSSNGYPDREILEDLLRRYKSRVSAFERPHRYHFGTHNRVERAAVREYLIVGQ